MSSKFEIIENERNWKAIVIRENVIWGYLYKIVYSYDNKMMKEFIWYLYQWIFDQFQLSQLYNRI